MTIIWLRRSFRLIYSKLRRARRKDRKSENDYSSKISVGTEGVSQILGYVRAARARAEKKKEHAITTHTDA